MHFFRSEFCSVCGYAENYNSEIHFWIYELLMTFLKSGEIALSGQQTQFFEKSNWCTLSDHRKIEFTFHVASQKERIPSNSLESSVKLSSLTSHNWIYYSHVISNFSQNLCIYIGYIYRQYLRKLFNVIRSIRIKKIRCKIIYLHKTVDIFIVNNKP